MCRVMRVKGEEWQERKEMLSGVVIKYVSVMAVDCLLVKVGPFVIQCLYEAQDVQSLESVFGQYNVEFNPHHHDLSNYALFALGYCISACSKYNTLKLNMWSIPREGLEMLGHGMKSVEYGGGSIEELDLSGSIGIMNEGEHLLNIPRHLLQKIEELILRICAIDQSGFENLAEQIPNLQSLTSLDISANPGGDGSLVKLLKASREHGKLRTLDMTGIGIGMDDVAALAGLLQSPSNLRELIVGGCHESPLATDVANQLVRTVLSPSSLNTVTIQDCEYPLDGIETISDNISNLTFYYPPDLELNTSPHPPTANPSKVKGGTKLSHILRGNTSLKELTLHIPLDKDEVHDIIDSLKYNHFLERLELCESYHSQYFSESAMDTRITLAHH